MTKPIFMRGREGEALYQALGRLTHAPPYIVGLVVDLKAQVEHLEAHASRRRPICRVPR